MHGSPVANDADKPVWARRVRKDKVRRLYENDAEGIVDEALIDDVGVALLARCESFLAAIEATGGRAPCPRCDQRVAHGRDQEEVLHCEKCGWELTWGEYFQTIQHKQLSGAEPVMRLFREYVAAFAGARTPREKVLLIDRLIHGFHWSLGAGHTTRPVAINLIQGRLRDVMEFLDDLTYSRKSTPGTRRRRAEWNRNMKTARGWYGERAKE